MKRMNQWASALVGLLVAISLAACSTTVSIQSEPAGADVFINNKKMGKTPFVASLDDFVFTEYMVTLKKEGYQDLNSRLAKEVKVGAIVGGVFLLLPFLWCYGPSPFQQFAMAKLEDKVSAQINNLQQDYDIYLGAEKVLAGTTNLEPGDYTMAYYKEGTLIASYEVILEPGNYYEIKS